MKQYIVDAFTDSLFSGNPAAVCIPDSRLSDKLMLDIAKENNLSETAFVFKTDTDFELRWFTPGGEIDLCGHATLAAARILMDKNMNTTGKDTKRLIFRTRSGRLTVEKVGNIYEMDFPAYDLAEAEVTEEIAAAAGARPVEAYMGRDLLCVFDSEETVRKLKPDMEKVKTLDGLLFQATAKGKDFDCVSRTFAPKLGVREDPVCGSGHCHIVPYWSEKLGKDKILAYQASSRGGVLYCRVKGDRVILGGNAVVYSEAELLL